MKLSFNNFNIKPEKSIFLENKLLKHRENIIFREFHDTERALVLWY